jgi:hypothetical protein
MGQFLGQKNGHFLVKNRDTPKLAFFGIFGHFSKFSIFKIDKKLIFLRSEKKSIFWRKNDKICVKFGPRLPFFFHPVTTNFRVSKFCHFFDIFLDRKLDHFWPRNSRWNALEIWYMGCHKRSNDAPGNLGDFDLGSNFYRKVLNFWFLGLRSHWLDFFQLCFPGAKFDFSVMFRLFWFCRVKRA